MRTHRRFVWQLVAVAVAITAASSLASDNDYQVIAISERTVKARLSAEAETSLQTREWFFMVPQPPELDRQIKITAQLTPNGRAARELSSQRRPILVSRVREPRSRINIQADYTLTLVARSLVITREESALPKLAELSDSERASWLLPSPLCAYREREFQEWLDHERLRRNIDEGVIEFGRRVFEYVRKEFEYELLNELDRRLKHVCREKKSDCLGLCVLFVSIMRANDIPARILVGRWAESAIPGATLGDQPYSKEHVKCEFHVAGVGWIPVDPATAILQPLEHVARRHFGLDTGDFITLHVNDQLIIQPPSSARRTIPFLQGIFYWLVAEGKTNDVRMRLQWQVNPLAP